MANRTDGSEGREVQSIHNKKKLLWKSAKNEEDGLN